MRALRSRVAGGDSEGAAVKALFALIVTAAIAGLSPSILGRATSQQGTQFRARTDIRIGPGVGDEDRNPITGLTAADFELTDNGVRQVVEEVSLQTVGIDVTLVLTEFSPIEPGVPGHSGQRRRHKKTSSFDGSVASDHRGEHGHGQARGSGHQPFGRSGRQRASVGCR